MATDTECRMVRLSASLVLLLMLSAGVAFAAGPDLTLMEARLEQMAGDRSGAAHTYSFWLDTNRGSPGAPVVFSRYFEAESSLPAMLDAARKLLRTAEKGIAVPGTFARIARLFEIAGKTEEARDAWLAAYSKGGPVSALEAAFLLSVEMNDMEALQSALASMKDAPAERLQFLQACMASQRGDSAAANEALLHTADTSTDDAIVLKALWMSYELAVRSGAATAREVALEKLHARFPLSPEYAMASAGSGAASQHPASVVPLALPGNFFSNSPALPLPPDPASVEQSGTPTSTPALSVQAGSFQMKENADDLVAELGRKGFSSTVKIDSAQGKPLYRVFAGTGLTGDDARALLDRLHGAGFSGFLMKDQP